MKGYASARIHGQPLVDPRPFASFTAPAAVGWPAADLDARFTDGYSVCAAQRYSLEDAAARDGLRIWGNLVAAP